MATSIERGGRVVCTAAAAVEVRAAGLRATNQPRARHHRAPMPHVGSFGLACARTFRGVPRVVGVQTAGEVGLRHNSNRGTGRGCYTFVKSP